jgi:hypothetical protein
VRHFKICGRPMLSTAAPLLCTAFLLGCDRFQDPIAPGTAAPAVAGATLAVQQVPFKGVFSGTGTAVTGGRCPVLTVQIHATGHATHVGRLTDEQSHCADPTSLAFTDGEFAFTAANGDQLVGTYFGDFVPLDQPLFTIVGHFTFTGGTGRFAGASGGGNASGVQNLATGEATVVLEGTISSVGSSRKTR